MLHAGANRLRKPTIRNLVVGWVLVAALAAGAVVPAAADAQAGAKASAFVESLAEEAIAALTASGVSREQRESRSRELLARYFAVDTIGRWVLGRFWQQATPKERKEYLSLFEDLIVTTYVDRFSRYSGEKLEVRRSVTDEASDDVLVFSEITRPSGGQPVEVGWRVRERDGTMKIIDVYVEGVSLGQTQRSEFASVIRNSGGKVSGLLDEMRKRIKRQA